MNNRLWIITFCHLPLIGASLILACLILLDSQVFGQFRNEQTFAWMLVVWIPLGILLGLIQLYIWVRWFVRRASPAARKSIRVGFMIIIAIFVFFIALRYLY